MNKKTRIAIFLAFFPIISVATEISDKIAPESTYQIANKKSITAKEFIVAAANPLAVEAGYNIIKNGGNAADALVAVQTVLGLVEPQSSGLGGGAFLVYYDAKKKSITTFDGRETAPLAAKPELFQDKNGKPLAFYDAVVGARSIGTPGTVKLLSDFHQRYGKQNWASLLQPAIKLAEQGFSVSARMAASIEADKARLQRYPDTKAYFFTADGMPLKEGSLLVNKAYAQTLKTLATQGEKAFYHGQIAKDIVAKIKSIQDNPGLLSLDDFSIYKVIERSAVCGEYREYDICGMGAPSSGALTLGQIFGMLSHFDLKSMKPSDPIAWQIIGDASRLAFADRGRYIADTDFVPMPEGLLDKEYLLKRASLITQGQALQTVNAGQPPWKKRRPLADDVSIELPSTTHIVIADKEGNIISMTSTIENGFGSRVMSNGFLLNNELTDFSFASQQNGYPIANRVEPRKRPRSSMSPTIVFKNDQPYMAIGSPGGSQIIGYVAQTLIAHVDWNMDIQDAINMPRIQNRFGSYDLEKGTTAETLKPALEKMGYKVNIGDLNSGLQAVVFDNGTMQGAADPRREGIAMGE